MHNQESFNRSLLIGGLASPPDRNPATALPPKELALCRQILDHLGGDVPGLPGYAVQVVHPQAGACFYTFQYRGWVVGGGAVCLRTEASPELWAALIQLLGPDESGRLALFAPPAGWWFGYAALAGEDALPEEVAERLLTFGTRLTAAFIHDEVERQQDWVARN